MKNLCDRPLLLLFSIVFLTAYVSIYFAFSRFGEYSLKETSANGSIVYEWMPIGFDSSGDGKVFEKIFSPMSWIDRRYIHTADKADSGQYRIKNTLKN